MQVSPIPCLQSEEDPQQDESELLAFEDNVLRTINEALELNELRGLTRFGELLDADEKLLRTLPEMDHYPERPNAKYVGILKSPPGDEPKWPACPGPRVFAYLKPFSTLPMLLATLNRKRHPTLIFGDKIPPDIERQYASESLRFVQRPLDMDAVGRTADVAICNATHGATTQLLLSGIPLLLLPLHAEQSLVARNVERLGAGLSAPRRQPKSMELKLDMLCNMETYKASARKFAASYRGFRGETLTDSILETITSLLPSNDGTNST